MIQLKELKNNPFILFLALNQILGLSAAIDLKIRTEKLSFTPGIVCKVFTRFIKRSVNPRTSFGNIIDGSFPFHKSVSVDNNREHTGSKIDFDFVNKGVSSIF